MLEDIWAKIIKDQIFDRSDALAFRFVLSLVPCLAIAYTVFALLGGIEKLHDVFTSRALEYLAPSFADQLLDLINTTESKLSPEALGVFGLLGFLYTGTQMVMKVQQSLDVIWGGQNVRTFVQSAFISTSALIFTPCIILASLSMNTFVDHAVLESALPFAETLSRILQVVPYLLSILFLSCIYKFLPKVKVSSSAALKAGFATGIVLQILKELFAIYGRYAMGSSIYGSLAAIPLFLIWISLACLVFYLGAELCYHLDKRRPAA